MATVTPTATTLTDNTKIVTWASIGDSDTCTAYEDSEFHDVSVEVSGTFGGATITMTGSNAGSNYGTLNDVFGTALTVSSSAAVKQIAENPRYYKPTTASGSSSSLTVTMLMQRNRKA